MTARILVVDDVTATARLLAARLGAEYYQIAISHSGLDAIEQALSWQPDLILLEVMMPEMDGYETCKRLKDDPRTQHIPIVMLTALHQPQARLRGLETGADDVLSKPVDHEILLARAKSLMRLKRLLDEWRIRGETARALGLGGDGTAAPSVAGARALIIDDCESGTSVMQESLAREGILAARAGTGIEAAQLAAAMNFDLIVLSLALINQDPLQLAADLRAAERTQNIPLLLVSDPDQKSRTLRGFDIGANDWVLRPIDETELRARARNQIRRKIYQDRLRADLGHALEMALTDPLTGFYNQRYLIRHLRGLIGSGQPQGLAVMMIDIDHFKSVNDRWGHPIGDQALRAVADALRRRIRAFDSIVRYGGEEFAVVMPGTPGEDAKIAAERLRTAIAEMQFYPEPGLRHRLTVSIGVSWTSALGTTAERLLQSADQALYRAKNEGRNRSSYQETT